MHYFIDSNVIIGYIFSLDNLNFISENFFNKNKFCFCSINVKDEVNNVFNDKNYQYNIFLLILCQCFDKFRDSSLINEHYVHNLINNLKPIGKLDINNMHDALDAILNNLDFDENHDAFVVKREFYHFKNDFQSIPELRKENIFNRMFVVPNHTQKDKNILDKIKKEGLRDKLIHGEDENILFDANEFSKNNKKLNLNFVSADQDFIKAIGILWNYLSLNKCINIMEFSSYN